MPIQRRGEPVPIDAAAVADAAGLRTLADDLARTCPGGVLVSDLSLGGWVPRQLARELADQLGVGLPAPAAAATPDAGGDPFALIGGWVDGEAAGDPAVRQGLADAQALLTGWPHHRCAVLVLAPRYAAAWGSDNVWALRFLAEAARGRGDRVILVRTPQAVGPPAGLHADPLPASPPSPELATTQPQPSDLTPGLATTAACALAIGRVHVVPPERRIDPAIADPVLLAELAAATRSRWVRAFAVCHRPHEPAGLPTLLRTGWLAFGAGASDLALRLLAAAARLPAPPEDRATALAELQSLRLILQRYAEMAAAPSPPGPLSTAVRDKLDRLQAWGAALQGDAAAAVARLDAIRRERGLAETQALDLYYRNVLALARFRSGDWRGALDLEQEIAKELDGLAPTPWHLRHINALNTGRLYRAAGDFARAAQQFDRAFAATRGARVPNDSLQEAVTWAQLRTAEAADSPTRLLSLWLAAVLHWLALPVPEALGWRVAQAILGRGAAREHASTPSQVSARLTEALTQAATAAGLDTAPPAAVPAFVHQDVASRQDPAGLVADAGGLGLVLRPDRLAESYRDPARDALAALAAAVLGQLLPRTIDPPMGSVVVDDRGGLGLPETPGERLELALRRGCDAVWLAGASIVPLPAARRRALMDACRLALGAGVDRVDKDGTVRFKRHFPPYRLDRSEPALLEAARAGRSVGATEARAAAFSLVEAGVLALDAEPALALVTETVGSSERGPQGQGDGPILLTSR